ncbi:MAG: BamA/TamA family outer membrane protein [Cyanobacteria bacterium J06642_11]
MRFSPTLLACCTVATLFGVPVFASEGTDVLEATATDAVVPDSASSPGTAVSPEPHREPAVAVLPPAATFTDADATTFQAIDAGDDEIHGEPLLAQQEVPVVPAESITESREDKLQRLLDGIDNTPEDSPPPFEAVPNPEPAVETPDTDGTVVEEPVQEEPQVLVAELAVTNVDGSRLDTFLEDIVYQAITEPGPGDLTEFPPVSNVTINPGRFATRRDLLEVRNKIFATGYFSDVRPIVDDTDLGARLTFVVAPNPVLTDVVLRTDSATGDVSLQDDSALAVPDETVELTSAEEEVASRRRGVKIRLDELFEDQVGSVYNLRDFQRGISDLNDWYESQGYVLARVVAAPQVPDSGVVTLIVAEGVIEDIEVRYINEDGESEVDGVPIDGKTRDFIVTREFRTQPGDVFRQANIQEDLQRVFGLGIFDDVRLSLDPGDEDPRKVKVVVNVDESNTGSVGAAVGFNLSGDVFGSVSYQQSNFGGNNQNLRTELQLSERELLFDVSFTDPWIAGAPPRTFYTVNGFNRRSISLIFDGGETDIDLPNGDTPRVNRFGGGVTFGRPLDDPWDDKGWSGSVGLKYQRVSIRDSDGDLSPVDQLGNDLSFSGDGRDDLLSIPLSLVWDQRNSSIAPTSGSLLRLGTEQTIPVGQGSIFFNRVRASYSRYIPVNFLRFGDGPQTIALNIQGGTVIGDLPPYEAFSLGGTNSVRGFDEGELGSGRSFAQATAEYRFPLFTSFLGGALFMDYGTDLGSGGDVPGDPAEIRGKPGNGFGYGAGIRVQTPLGALRLDYGFNDEGDGRIHFGIGERF